MNIKKMFLALLTLSCSAVLFAGCGKKSVASEVKYTPDDYGYYKDVVSVTEGSHGSVITDESIVGLIVRQIVSLELTPSDEDLSDTYGSYLITLGTDSSDILVTFVGEYVIVDGDCYKADADRGDYIYAIFEEYNALLENANDNLPAFYESAYRDFVSSITVSSEDKKITDESVINDVFNVFASTSYSVSDESDIDGGFIGLRVTFADGTYETVYVFESGNFVKAGDCVYVANDSIYDKICETVK